MREETFLQPDHEHVRKLEPLGRVDGHEIHRVVLVVPEIHVGQERHLGEKPLHRGILGAPQIGFRARDQLVHVLDSLRRLGGILLEEIFPVPDLRDQLGQEGRRGEGRERPERDEEARQFLELPRAGPGHRGAQLGMLEGFRHRESPRFGEALEPVQRRASDPARRHVQDAVPRHGVPGLDQSARVGHDVLDLAELVRNSRAPERVLHRARLRVGAVQDHEVPVVEVLGPARLEEERDHALSFGLLILGQVHAEPLPDRVLGPELLLLARGVVLHDSVRGAENRLRGPVVLRQAQHRRLGKGLLEGEDVPHVGAAPAVDGLVVVPHHGEVPVRPRETLDEAELDAVRVLVLVHQHVQEARGVRAMDLLVQLEQAHRVSEQVVEVHRPAGAERLLIAFVDLDEPPIHRGERGLLILLRTDPLVLELGDPRSGRRGGQALVLRPHSLQELAQDRALVVGVVDHEILGIPEKLRVTAEDPNARGVEGSEPDTQVLPSEKRLGARPHLPGRLVREGEGEDGALGDSTLAHEVRDASRQDARLPAARSGQDQEGPAGVLDRLTLHGVQVHGSPSTRASP